MASNASELSENPSGSNRYGTLTEFRTKNLLIQQGSHNLICRIESGYVLVLESPFKDEIKVVRGPKTVFISPFTTRRTLISLAKQTLKVDYSSTIGEKNDIQVTVPVFINWHVDATDDKSILNFYKEKNAVNILETKISNVISKVVSKCGHDKLKSIKISFTDSSKTFGLESSVLCEIQDMIDIIKPEIEELGIVLDDMIFRDVDIPKKLSDKYVEREEQRIQMEIDTARAEKEKELAAINLEIEKINNQKMSDRIEKMLKAGLSGDQVAAIIKRESTPSNATFFEGLNSGMDAMMPLLSSHDYNNNSNGTSVHSNDDTHDKGMSR